LLAEGTATAQAFQHVKKSHRVDWTCRKTFIKVVGCIPFRYPKVLLIRLTLDRDPHGNVQVSKIETEKLLIEMVEAELART
jgi:pyrophosphate--fructose-6-phosphate 1-phosphotransferase